MRISDWSSDVCSSDLYVERDIPLMGPKIPATRMKTFWAMLAHYHGQQVVLSAIGKSLEVSHTTARSYLDILTDFYMIRQIKPWAGNTKKRLVKSPQIYLLDTGILHHSPYIPNFDDLPGHPLFDPSWDALVAPPIIPSLSP